MNPAQPRLMPLALALMAVMPLTAHANYVSPDGDFNLSGFGTLGAVKSSTNDAKVNYPGQGGGAGTSPSLNPDSKLAVQGTYKLSPTISGTAQLMTKFNAEGQYEPTVQWAFAKWQASPDWSLRLGRIGAPFFMISDFRDVGYANTPVRPPLDVYAQVIFSQFEGGDLTYSHTLGSLTLTSTLWLGNAANKFALTQYDPNAVGPLTGKNITDPANVKSRGLVGLNIQAELDNGLTVRLGHVQGKHLSISAAGNDELFATANYLTAASLLPAPFATNLAAVLDKRNIRSSFSGIGVTYDTGDWVFGGEFTKRRTDSYLSSTTGYYGQVGYRLGKWTPFIGLSKLKTDRTEDNPLAALMGSPADALYQSAQLVFNSSKLDQRTQTIGARYDIRGGVALKGQWDRVSKPADSSGTFFAPSSSFVAEKRTVNVLTLSVDFVF